MSSGLSHVASQRSLCGGRCLQEPWWEPGLTRLQSGSGPLTAAGVRVALPPHAQGLCTADSKGKLRIALSLPITPGCEFTPKFTGEMTGIDAVNPCPQAAGELMPPQAHRPGFMWDFCGRGSPAYPVRTPVPLLSCDARQAVTAPGKVPGARHGR